MKLMLMTLSSRGLPLMILNELKSSNHEVCVVQVNQGENRNIRWFKKKVKKALKIGVGGVIVGYWLRKRYSTNTRYYKDRMELSEYCKIEKIQYLKITRTNNPLERDISLINSLNADLGISAGNSFISPRIFNIPRLGMINIHHEELPAYKGAQSVIWQLNNHNKTTGFSFHFISSKIDDGSLIKVYKLPIEFRKTLKDTLEYNSFKLKQLSANKINEIISHLDESTQADSAHYKSYTTPGLLDFLKAYKFFRKCI